VIFGKESPTDFSNAMKLEDAFKLEKRGKKDYFKKKKNQDLGDQLYGWMAGSEDLENSENEVGKYLRDHMELTARKEDKEPEQTVSTTYFL
jgi:hypothetical protein